MRWTEVCSKYNIYINDVSRLEINKHNCFGTIPQIARSINMKTLMNKLLIISTLALSMSLFAKPDQHTCEKIRSLMFNESNNRFTWGCTDFVEQGSKFDLSRDMNQIFINELIENEKDNDLKNSATDAVKEYLTLLSSSKVKQKIDNLFSNISHTLREPGAWKACPQKLSRECNVIALSKNISDNRGKYLDGVPAPTLYEQNVQSQLELLEVFVETYVPEILDGKTVHIIESVELNLGDQEKLHQYIEKFKYELDQLDKTYGKLKTAKDTAIRSLEEILNKIISELPSND